jgi:serine/threonine-protein kinase
MESQNGLGRELLWGLLARQHQLVSGEALAVALEVRRVDATKPLWQILQEDHALEPQGVARVDSLTRNYLERDDANPVKIFQKLAMGEALRGLLELVADPDWRSRLRQAALAMGIEEAIQSSLTVGAPAGDLTGLVADRGQVDQGRFEGGDDRGVDGPESTVELVPGHPGAAMTPTECDPGQAPPHPGDPTATRPWSGDDTEEPWPPPPAASDQSPGVRLDDRREVVAPLRYRIVRSHAEGGLGAVFVAIDEELHREVALKEILQRHAHITENRLRFLLEAEVTGGLEHPGIVPVHGLGQYEDGRPYYAMRFIRGDSLKSAIAQFHAADGPNRDPGERALSLRQLLTHFVDVCDAIAYAHSRGVIHRDIKPANVMLGKFGETLVVDWGLAKPLLRCFPPGETEAPAMLKTVLDPAAEQTIALDGQAPAAQSPATPREQETHQERPLIPPSMGKSSETLAGTRVGTPAFMSPEQAAGHIDRIGPPSDIYSLGATLYNILTGKPPFFGTDLTKTLARVVDGDFPHPRSVNSRVPRPLEGIILQAMALTPKDRYFTAKELRDDIEHWMADEPVSAYRDPLPARLARWARRHKTAVAATAALLLAAVAALTAGSILLERERARTDRERALAVKNYGYAYEAAETMLGRVGDVDLADIPQMEPVRLELLQTAKLQFDKLLEQRSKDPEILLLEGRTRARLGDVLEMMGQYAEAERNYLDAIESLRALEPRLKGDDRPRRELARAHHGLGVLLRKLNRFREAESALREAVRLREQLAARSPDDRILGRSLSESRYYLGALLTRLANPHPEDEQLYRQAIKDQEALLAISPDEPENRLKLARYLNNLAMLEARTEPAKAEREFRRVLDLLAVLDRSKSDLPGARWQAARASNNLATLLAGQGRGEKSREILKQAHDVLDRLTAEFPRILQYRRELASIFNNLGRVGRESKRNDLAAESFRQAANLLKDLAQRSPEVPDYQEDMDIALFQVAMLKAETDLPAAEREFTAILADQALLVIRYPNVPAYRNALGRNLLEYAKMLHGRRAFDRAPSLAEDATSRFLEALAGDPGNRTYGKNLSEALTLQVLIALAMNQTEEVAALADRLVAARPEELTAYLTASSGLARCVAMTATDDGLAADVRQARGDAYGRMAVEILRKAVDRGLLQTSDPLRDEEFIPLRTREDFIDLFKTLRDRQAPATG